MRTRDVNRMSRRELISALVDKYRAGEIIVTWYDLVIHNIATGDSLIVDKYPTVKAAQCMRDDLENRLGYWLKNTLAVYILPVDGN